MTGIRNSNKLAMTAMALACLAGVAAPPLAADELLLEGSERLSGCVRAINADGSVLLETPLSPDPVPLKPNSIRKVVFSDHSTKPDAATCGVTLVNGDVLPGDVEAADEQNLTLNSSIAGHFVIPRAQIHSLQLGVHQEKSIYAGPDGLNGWSREPATSEHWSFSDGSFHVRGSGRISRQLDLPQQFVFRFKLSWVSEPNIKVYFAAAPGTGETPLDRYYLTFNSAGIEIKREASSGKRYTTITTLARPPKLYPGKHVTIEIRVDRVGRNLQLYLNDEPEGPFKDPLDKAPDANGVIIESMIDEASSLQFSNIEVLDWNLKGERRRSEDRGDVTKDVLIGSKSERFSGKLVEVKKGPEGLLYVFKSAFQDEAIEVPEAEISTVFFVVGKKDAPADAAKDPFILQLRGGGSLHVSACAFAGEQVEATHQSLGKLTLQRDGITAFERISAKSKEAPQP